MWDSKLACFRLLAILALPMILLAPQTPKANYLELTSSSWENEVRNWHQGGSHWFNKGGGWTFWYRKTPLTRQWLERLGLLSSGTPEEMPLLQGDLAAVDVLIELLGSRNRDARQIAAQALEMMGEDAQRLTQLSSKQLTTMIGTFGCMPNKLVQDNGSGIHDSAGIEATKTVAGAISPNSSCGTI